MWLLTLATECPAPAVPDPMAERARSPESTTAITRGPRSWGQALTEAVMSVTGVRPNRSLTCFPVCAASLKSASLRPTANASASAPEAGVPSVP